MHHKYLDAAIEIAIKAHSGQLDRYGEPYIFHPIRVMIKADTIENKIIAILHDVIEKSSYSAKDLRGIGFSGSVVDTVVSLSRIDKESYQDYIDRVSLNQEAVKIKLLDLDDNISSLANEKSKRNKRLLMSKYQNAKATLVNLI